MKLKKIDWLFIFSLFIAAFVFWWPTRNLPFWWDSAGVVAIGSQIIIDSHFKIIELGIPGNLPHTILFVYMHAVLWKIFGQSLLVSHLLMLFFTFLTLFYTYRLTNYLSNGRLSGKLAGVAAGILLLFTPVFYAQVGIIYSEIPIAAFALMSVYYLIQGKKVRALISNLLLVFTKEVAVFIVVVEWLWVLMNRILSDIRDNKKKKSESFFRLSIYFLIPIAAIALFYVIHKVTTGWWYIPPGTRDTAIFQSLNLNNLFYVFSFVFVEQWRIAITILSAIFLEETVVRNRFHKDVFRSDVLLFILIPLATAIFFGLTEFLHRYIIVGLPFLYIFFTYLFGVLLQKKKFKMQFITIGAVVAVLCGLFYSQWNLKRTITYFYFPPLEDNLEYKDVISISQVLVSYIEKRHPRAKFLTSFPVNYMLAQPFQGYVKKTLLTRDCNKIKEGDKFDFVIFHPYSPVSIACLKIIQGQHLKPYKNFERNGKFISIYGP